MMPAWARDVRNVLTVVGVGASIVLWCSYQWFYMQLGITPEDVGIGLDDLLWQSSGALVLVLLIASSLVLVGAPLALLVGIVTRPARRPQNKFVRMTWRGYKRATRELVLTWWLPPAAALPATLFGADERLVLLWFAVTFAVSLRHRDSVIVLDVAVVRALAAITALLGIALFWIGTSANARRVEAGERVPNEIFGLPIFAFRALPLKLDIAGIDRCRMYLGTSDGFVVLYDLDLKAVTTVPSRNLRLTFDPHLRSVRDRGCR